MLHHCGLMGKTDQWCDAMVNSILLLWGEPHSSGYETKQPFFGYGAPKFPPCQTPSPSHPC